MQQGQGHQIWYELVDPKQGYNNVKFEKPHLNSVCQKANDYFDKVFVKSTTFKLQWTRTSKRKFAVCIFETSVILKQSHQTYNVNVDPKHVYNHAKFEDLTLTVSEKKTTSEVVFFPNEEVCQLSPLNKYENQKKWYTHYLLDIINNCTKFQLNPIRT